MAARYLYSLAGPPPARAWPPVGQQRQWPDLAGADHAPRRDLESLALAKADARVLYAVVVDRTGSRYLPAPYAVYASSDAG